MIFTYLKIGGEGGILAFSAQAPVTLVSHFYPGRLLGGTIKDSHTGVFSLKVVQNFSNILMSWVGIYEEFGDLEFQDTKISN